MNNDNTRSMCGSVLKRRKFDAINRVNNGHPIYIEGHRGMNKLQPQNTILSFKEAIQHELDSVELDIWLTKDHVPVVIHGGDFGELEEFTTGKGNIKETTITDLALIKTKEGDQPIPTLDEVFTLCKDKMFINIELKDDRVELTFNAVIALAEKHSMLNQIALSSFKHDYYTYVKQYAVEKQIDIEFGFLYERIGNPKYRPYNFGFENVTMNFPQLNINEEMVRKAREKKCGVLVWFTMADEENEEVYRKVFDLGVDVMCCNKPNEAKAFRERYVKEKEKEKAMMG